MQATGPRLPIYLKAPPARLIELSENLFPERTVSITILPLEQITFLKEQGLNDFLHSQELEKLNTLTHAKRNREWLGGRICAKEGLSLYLQKRTAQGQSPSHLDYMVKNEDSGRPFFAHAGRYSSSLPELSITHSRDFAAALITSSQCGIDLQYSSEKLERVRERFCSDAEGQLLQRSMARLSSLSQLTLLWSGKEAVKKMLSPEGIPGFHELILRQITPQGGETVVLHFSKTSEPEIIFQVAAGMVDHDYWLALCLLPNLYPVDTQP